MGNMWKLPGTTMVVTMVTLVMAPPTPPDGYEFWANNGKLVIISGNNCC